MTPGRLALAMACGSALLACQVNLVGPLGGAGDSGAALAQVEPTFPTPPPTEPFPTLPPDVPSPAPRTPTHTPTQPTPTVTRQATIGPSAGPPTTPASGTPRTATPTPDESTPTASPDEIFAPYVANRWPLPPLLATIPPALDAAVGLSGR